MSRTHRCEGGARMKTAIMQPYFLPYIGYFQLIEAVDLFIVYDNIKYTKKGWINRNRMLQNGKDVMFTLPLRNESDFADVRDRELAANFDRDKLLNQLNGAYRRSPYFAETFPLIERIVRYEDGNLFKFIHHSIVRICEHLGIATQIGVSSDFPINHTLKSQDKVLALCQAVGADTYINAIGGIELYSVDEFHARNIELKFIKSRPLEYAQYGNPFVPWLSIIDVMMFNSREKLSGDLIGNFDLI